MLPTRSPFRGRNFLLALLILILGVGLFLEIPVEARQLDDIIYQARGVANPQLITTRDGNIVFDTGLAMQVAKRAVKSIWEYYATWFHFDSTTEAVMSGPFRRRSRQ